MFCAVIVAAGSSRRAGFDKLAAPLCGVSVLQRSIDAFAAAGAQPIVVVCPQERWDALFLHASVELIRVDGGAERQDSVQAGMAALPSDCEWVAVHDGARPLIAPKYIKDCLAVAQQTGAAACAHPIVDTLKRADANDCSLPEVVSREHLWGMETPQIFSRQLLLKAYDYVRQHGCVVTDEVSAVEQLGQATSLVSGGVNLKITMPYDLALAELIWQQSQDV
ncbi:MAG: 2-C-methyl-D-erythritol 4-phosphate cytidylyltransferase [Akkermansia sp.]